MCGELFCLYTLTCEILRYISRKWSQQKLLNKSVWGKQAVFFWGGVTPVPLPSYVSKGSQTKRQQSQLLGPKPEAWYVRRRVEFLKVHRPPVIDPRSSTRGPPDMGYGGRCKLLLYNRVRTIDWVDETEAAWRFFLHSITLDWLCWHLAHLKYIIVIKGVHLEPWTPHVSCISYHAGDRGGSERIPLIRTCAG